MTGPNSQQAAQQAAMSAAMSRAVDLSAVKERAEAANRRANGGDAGGAAPGGTVIDVGEQDFSAEVVERSMQVPVVVDLWADWCGPCKQLSPVLERLAEQGNGSWVLARIDVDANPRIAQIFGVQSIPTVVAIASGQPVDAFSGALPEDQIRDWLAELLDNHRDTLPGIAAAEAGADGDDEPEAEDPRFTGAEQALDDGDLAGAEAAYQRILEAEPDNEQAKLALGQVRLMARAQDADPGAIARADAAPADVDAQVAASDAEIAAGRVEDAFSRLVATVRQTAGDDRDRVRTHLVGLFDLFPADDQRVMSARRNLATALF